MLTRYRELYNSLTHSSAFKEEGRLDNSRVNKNAFTPHNLKALLIGANSAIAIHYTINDKDKYYVEPITLHCSYVNPVTNQIDPQKYMKVMQEDKGMIDALIDGLKFNYVEEIVFFTGDFISEEDLGKEMNRITRFASDSTITSSMKRLRGIAVVEGSLTDEFKQLSSKKPILEQLKDFGVPYKVLCKLEPERTELGLLVNRGLDGTEYKMDTKYEPKQEKLTMETRLSHYFYKEEQDALKAKKAREEAEKKAAEQKKEEEQKSSQRQRVLYVQQLKEQGYRLVGNNEIIAGSDKIFSKVFTWLKSFCTEKPDPSTGYKYKTCNLNSDLLKSKGVMNTKDANIWSPDIFSKDEDLTFRLFVKENDLSFDILIKLPVDLNDFDFNGSSVGNIALIFSNKNREKGKVYQCSILQQPEIKSLKGTKGVDCVYDAVEISLVKDLMDFKDSQWLFLDYLKACQGETNKFSEFRRLPLGDKIVVGVKPNALKIETFDCTGAQQTSGIICGQAGSGKSALMDSLVVQFMALKGNMGNGSVVLMDAKQEWPPLWREVLQAKGIPFYGFDGGLIEKQEDIKQKVIKNGKPQIAPFAQPITQEVGGMVFIMTLYQIIQGILKKSGCKDIKTFNASNQNVGGITRLPRIAIFIDEMNTFSVNAVKGSVAKEILNLITGGANLTRTAGYMWFLCGQDVPKSIISSEKRGSFKYNIMGTMDKERYEYFEVTENPDVVKYEEKNATPEKPHPIMTQGTFYAGQKGKTELVRSMFLPDEGKMDALNLIDNFEGMYELDALVKYALSNNLFDDFTFGVGNKNNIVFAVLRDIGVISDAEFEEATNRIFAEKNENIVDADFEIDIDDTGLSSDFENSQDTLAHPQASDNAARPIRPVRPQPTTQEQGQAAQRPIRPPAQQNRPARPQPQQKTYTGKLHIESNPFEIYKGESNHNTLLSTREITKIIIEDISKNIGSTSLIKEFRVSADGVLIFNNIAYMPQFEESFINSLPMTLQEQVLNGWLVDLYDLRQVYKFENLTTLIIEDEGLAQGRARKEMGIGFRKRWSVIFKKFAYLNYVKVGHIEYARSNPDTNVEQGILDKFKADPTSTFAPKGQGSRLDKVWDSKPVRVITNAVGWTVGVQAVWLAASLFGPWGLLFGALAIAGAYNEHKNSPEGQHRIEEKRRREDLETETLKAKNKKQNSSPTPRSRGRA